METEITDTTNTTFGGSNQLEQEDWKALEAFIIYYNGRPVGTVAAG